MGIYPVNAVVNATVFLPIGRQHSKGDDPRSDILACATGIRDSLKKLKDPRVIEDMVTDFAKIEAQTAWDKHVRGPPKEGFLVVNITRRSASAQSGLSHG